MATYQTIRLGRLTLREDFSVSESSDNKISLTGRESMGANGARTRLQVEQRRDDVNALIGDLVAVKFTDKPTLDGFYYVTESNAELTEWDGVWAIMNWTMALVRCGYVNTVDIESRLSGAITRVNDFTVTGARFHAPAVNAKAYYTGPTIPIYIDRVGSDGTVRVYQSLAQGINPRWGCTVADYEKGRVRFIDSDGLERSGVNFEVSAGSWELNNSLIRLTPGSAGNALDVAAWASGAWSGKTWDILYGTSPVTVGTADYVSVLDNTYESITIRLVKDLVPGRMMIDLTLRRGSSVVEMYIQHEYSTTLTVKRATVVAGTSGTGYIAATAADGAGMKSIVGSARTFTADAPNHAITKTTTATLDAFIGVTMSAAAGNAPADVYAQFIGSPAELVRGIRR